MKNRSRWMAVSVLTLCLMGGIAHAEDRPLIQMAILLDTSGSMDGLIEQAKAQLWKVVNEMARARRNGRIPRLQVALYEYGKSAIPASEGHLRMIVPLSEDLDRISQELFQLRTNGGEEYCGRVIAEAVKHLRWSETVADYRVIFIAGNEPFSQGDLDYTGACRAAVSRGIVVNTIFCGDHREGIRSLWKDGADRAEGSYMSIDHTRKIVHVPAPQDAEIVRLGRALNETYVAYGSDGARKKERQALQDKNASGLSREVLVERSVAKASPQYANSGWDLIDAITSGRVAVGDLEEEDLPAEMRGMSPEERSAMIDKLKKQRVALQERIAALNRERTRFLAEKRRQMTVETSLDEAMVQTVRRQAARKKYTFE